MKEACGWVGRETWMDGLRIEWWLCELGLRDGRVVVGAEAEGEACKVFGWAR